MVTCLLIDDDPDDHLIFTMALEDVDKNVSCRHASTAMEAVRLLQTESSFNPQFIFIDIDMPHVSGLECLSIIRSMERLSETSIVMCSTSSRAGNIDAARKLGARHYFVKQGSLKVISETLAKLFHKEALPFVIPEGPNLT